MIIKAMQQMTYISAENVPKLERLVNEFLEKRAREGHVPNEIMFQPMQTYSCLFIQPVLTLEAVEVDD